MVDEIDIEWSEDGDEFDPKAHAELLADIETMDDMTEVIAALLSIATEWDGGCEDGCECCRATMEIAEALGRRTARLASDQRDDIARRMTAKGN